MNLAYIHSQWSLPSFAHKCPRFCSWIMCCFTNTICFAVHSSGNKTVTGIMVVYSTTRLMSNKNTFPFVIFWKEICDNSSPYLMMYLLQYIAHQLYISRSLSIIPQYFLEDKWLWGKGFSQGAYQGITWSSFISLPQRSASGSNWLYSSTKITMHRVTITQTLSVD